MSAIVRPVYAGALDTTCDSVPRLRLLFAGASKKGSVGNDDRLDLAELAQIERLAHDGLQGGLLEQAWCRRTLAGSGGPDAAG